MDFDVFLSKLQESQNEDTQVSLASWNLLCKFRDSNLPLCVNYIIQILNDPDMLEHIKCLSMILFKKLYKGKNQNQISEIPNEILSNLFQTLINLFETESLQLVSVAASIVFLISSAEIKAENNLTLISGFAENLQKSTNPYIVFGFCCLLFDLCREFSLPNEINFLVVSAVFEQLSSGQLPPVVASRCIALFRSTVPNYSAEFISSQLFTDILKMLTELTALPETKTESLLAWAVIISLCSPYNDEILDSIGDMSIHDMLTSDDDAVLIATCVFWSDAARAFAKSTTSLVQYMEPLLRGLFRLLCIRAGDQIHEEFDELPQTAVHTL